MKQPRLLYSSSTLEHVGDVHGHLVDLRRIVLLDVSEDTHVVGLDEVDRHTLSPESP